MRVIEKRENAINMISKRRHNTEGLTPKLTIQSMNLHNICEAWRERNWRTKL